MRSIRFRLTAWYVIVLGIILTLFGVFAYQTVKTRLLAEIVKSLQSTALKAEEQFDPLATTLVRPADALSEQNTVVLSFNRPGRLIDTSHAKITTAVDAGSVREALNDGESKLKRLSTGAYGELLVYTTPVVRDGKTVGAVQAARSLRSYATTLSGLLFSLIILIPFSLALAAAGGLFMSTKALSPIEEITRTTKRIGAYNLDERIDVRTEDEVGRLAETINDLFSRLKSSIEKDRRFVADASHELRTPLTILRGEIEVALNRERTPEEYKSVLKESLQAVEEMSDLVEGLLTLARLDRNAPLEREDVDVAELCLDAALQAKKAHPKKDVVIDVDVPRGSLVVGDRLKLKQLLANLIDNAVKFSPKRGRVAVVGSTGKGLLSVAISDNGPGIDPADLPNIFDRFYRGEKARSKGQGSGIGLSIAQRIAEVHGGRITVESEVGKGSVFTVELPDGLDRKRTIGSR